MKELCQGLGIVSGGLHDHLGLHQVRRFHFFQEGRELQEFLPGVQEHLRFSKGVVLIQKRPGHALLFRHINGQNGFS